jgi:DNA-binding NtrC family response regulator
MAKVLLVDDEMTMVQTVGDLLRADGHQVVPFTDFLGASGCVSSVAPDLIIAHLSLEKNVSAALGILQKARSLNPPSLMMLLAPQAPAAGALECLKRGAYDCLAKPFTLEDVKLRVQRALSYQAAVCENAALRRQLQSQSHLPQIIGSSPAMQEVVGLIDRVADSDSCVFIRGPAGSGKQLIARTIHANSRRRFSPFAVVNCDSVPDNLLEIELFGERKPPFAPAHIERLGVFREADGGTVLLNNVEALSPPLQSRLFTLLQNRQMAAPGENGAVAVDVRILAATTEPLRNGSGRLFSDLYQRLGEVCVVLPWLRERAEDIPLLITHFLSGKIHPRSQMPCDISREAVTACRAYGWPGNVREMQNALNHACLLCRDGMIQLSDLPLAVQQLDAALNVDSGFRRTNGERSAASQKIPMRRIDQAPMGKPMEPCFTDSRQLIPLKRFLRDQEISYLQRTLEKVGGSKERAAEVLGISLATMYRKLSEPVPAGSEPA